MAAHADPHELPPLQPDEATQHALDLMSATLRAMQQQQQGVKGPVQAGWSSYGRSSHSTDGLGERTDGAGPGPGVGAGAGAGAGTGAGPLVVTVCADTGGGSSLGPVLAPPPSPKQAEQKARKFDGSFSISLPTAAHLMQTQNAAGE